MTRLGIGLLVCLLAGAMIAFLVATARPVWPWGAGNGLLPLLFAVLTFAILSAILHVGFVREVRRIAAKRVGETYQDFRNDFASTLPSDVLLATHDTLQDWMKCYVHAFPVRAGDDLEKIYGIADEELDDTVGEILRKTGRRWPAPEEIENTNVIRNVGDVVSFVASAPMAEQENEGESRTTSKPSS